MACKLLERDQVPEPPHRVLNGVVDDGLQRWRFRNSLLVTYMRYAKGPARAGQLPWTELWTSEDARR